MGREIRRVPPGWEHPKNEQGHYKPMYDRDYESAALEWMEGAILWNCGKHPNQNENCMFYWEWDGNPPNEKYYRPAFSKEPTWFQVYETVSEGRPVSPPFETKDELIDYLVQFGDIYDQHAGRLPPSRESVERFVKQGWAGQDGH